MNRRTFIQSSVASAAALSLSNDLFAKTVDKFGVQLWSLPKVMEKNVNDGLSWLSKAGYSEVELYGPYPFSTDSAKKRWEAVSKQVGFSGSGFYNLSLGEFVRMLKANGLTAPSIHCDLDTMQNNMAGIADAAQEVGFKYVTLPAIPEDKRKSPDDYKRLADDFNKIGETARKYGLKFTYHNHGYGFKPIDGVVPLYTLLDQTDPKLVVLEMDLYWTVAGGADPVTLLKKYSGRYELMHIKDMTKKVSFSGDGGSPQQWIELFPFMTTAGNGVLDLPTILSEAKKHGMKHFFVEQDSAVDPQASLKESATYLKKI